MPEQQDFDNTNPNRKNTTVESPVITALSELTGSLLKLAQERIIERVEETANRITHNVITMLTVIFLGLIGLVFILVGFSMWLGTISGFGAWFGLLITGIVIFVIALIIALAHKSKK